MVKTSVEHILRNLFDETLKNVVQTTSFKSDIVRNMVCLLLPKDLQKQTFDSRPDVITFDSKLLSKISKPVSN